MKWLRYWISLLEKAGLDHEFTIDCMGSSEEFTWWFFSKNTFEGPNL
jgi:hypothetical protein